MLCARLQFPYTCAVVSEALRLYPPAATTIREVPAGGPPLQLGRYAVPAGSSVFVASYVMQRDPELWPRAAEFLPERWLPVRVRCVSFVAVAAAFAFVRCDACIL
jgi:cytochrome P450